MAPRGHVHVSEREVAHHWPDGQWDDAAWEDCTMDSGIEFARATHDRSIPATHFEAERLRDAAGEDPLGGTSNHDARRGMKQRYNYSPTLVQGFSAVWSALRPGWAASAQGSMGAFPYWSTLRRHQPSFGGAHDVFVARVDTLDRVWWCDPLGALGRYQGEFVSKLNFQRYVNALTFPDWHLVGKMLAPVAAPTSGNKTKVGAGYWHDYQISGTKATGYKVEGRDRRYTAGFSAYIGSIIPITWEGKPRRFAKLLTGIYQDRFVDLNAGNITLIPG